MNMTAILLLITLLTVRINSNAQQITISAKNSSLQTVFEEVKRQTGYTFIYTQELIRQAKRVTLHVKRVPLETVLQQCFKEQPLTYTIHNKMVVIKEKEESKSFTAAPASKDLDHIVVTGSVKSDSGEAIHGVSLIALETNRGTATNRDGRFTIMVPLNGTIAVSAVGYKKKLVKVTSAAPMAIRLAPLSLKMDEVVIIGYGMRRRSDVTGAIGSVQANVIEKSGVTYVDQVLQGRIAGVQMTQNTGLPGGGSSIQIRGLSSINATNEPIFVIDGVIISSGTGSYYENAFSAVNPADIESIDVLKDASATAIYGAQGANGVIIITTKRGKAGPTRIVIDSRYGMQSLLKYLPIANLREYAQHQNEFNTLKGWNLSNYFANPSFLSLGTNWQKEIFRPAAVQNYNLSVSGGNTVTTYRVSGNYLRQDGIASGSGFERITASTAIDTKLKPWAKLGGTTTLSQTKQVITITDWDLINSAVRQSPSVPVRNLDGSYGGPEDPDDQLSNPLALSKLLDKGIKRLGIRGNVYLEVKPVNTVAIKTEFATDMNQEMVHSFVPTYRLGNRYNSETVNTQSQRYSSNWSWRNIVTYNQKFGSQHTVNVMLGHELTARSFNYIFARRRGGSNNLPDINAGNPLSAENGGNSGRVSYASVFGRTFYSFRNRYMITATLRYDGSSNFAEGHQWGFFPSTAFAWKVSDEPFLRHIPSITNLKLRVGYGKVANANISQFAYTTNITNVPTIWGTGALVANMANPDVTWESSRAYNIGVDLGLLNNRIELVADAYVKRTDNLLLELTLPGITGAQQGGPPGSASAPWANVGSLQNKGMEFSLNTVNIQKKGFIWRSSIIFTANRNKVLKLNSETAQLNKTYDLSGNPIIVTRTEAGRSIGEFWAYKVIGRINAADDLYDKNGNIKIALPANRVIHPRTGIWAGDLIFDDYNKDGVIDQNDRQYLGSPLPKFTYGFGNTFTYKNVDLAIFIAGSYGNKVMNFLNLRIDDPNAVAGKTRRAATDYAHLTLKNPNGPATDIFNVFVSSGHASMPRMTADDVNSNNRLSSRFIEDGSYLRLQNVNLSFTFPRKTFAKLGLNTATFYFSAQNLFTFTKYSGYDPGVGMTKDQYSSGSQNALLNGLDPGRYPTPRIFTTGFSLGL